MGLARRCLRDAVVLPPGILALATAVAGYVAVPMRVVEIVIPEPSSD